MENNLKTLPMITVGALLEYLKGVPEHYTIIISNDGEGNSFSPMVGEISYGNYLPECAFTGGFEFEDEKPSSIVFFQSVNVKVIRGLFELKITLNDRPHITYIKQANEKRDCNFLYFKLK